MNDLELPKLSEETESALREELEMRRDRDDRAAEINDPGCTFPNLPDAERALINAAEHYVCILTQWRFGRQYTNEWYEANRKYSGAEASLVAAVKLWQLAKSESQKGI